MKINKRLKQIGDLVEANSFCLDVGCDHAFLDIYLVKKECGIRAVASDIAEGPLDSAKSNIAKEKLEDKIDVRLGNGLDTYVINPYMVVCSKDSYLKKYDVLKNIKTIIVSPNNYQEDVKRFLCKHGFYINDEVMVKEGKFIYQIIKFKKGKKRYSKKEFFFGPIFRKKG